MELVRVFFFLFYAMMLVIKNSYMHYSMQGLEYNIYFSKKSCTFSGGPLSFLSPTNPDEGAVHSCLISRVVKHASPNLFSLTSFFSKEKEKKMINSFDFKNFEDLLC
jgi:hypothetical protein